MAELAYTDSDEIARDIARDFKRRRIERNLTRSQIADKSGVAVSNIARFEQKGLISLSNLISLCMALGYLDEIKTIFAAPKYSTMQELTLIRKNSARKKAYHRNEKD